MPFPRRESRPVLQVASMTQLPRRWPVGVLIPAERGSVPPQAQIKGTQAGRSPCPLFKSVGPVSPRKKPEQWQHLPHWLGQYSRAQALALAPGPGSWA